MTGSLDYRDFATMLTEASDIVGAASDTETRILKDAMNRRYAQVASVAEIPELSATDFSGLRKSDDSTLTSLIAADPYMPLPWNCGRLRSLHYQTGAIGEITLVESAELVQRAGSALNTAGAPLYAAIVGETAQYRALPQDESGEVDCASSMNDNSKQVHITFQPSTTFSGLDVFEDVGGTFSDGQVMSAQLEAGYPIKSVSLPEGWVGGLTIKGRITNTQIVSIPNMEVPTTELNENAQVAKRLLLRLWPVPDASYPLTIVYWKRPERLTEDSDIPLIPISNWLVQQAVADFLRAQGKFSSAGAHDAQASKLAEATFARDKQPGRTVLTPYMGSFTRQTGMRSWVNSSAGWGGGC